jgi:hypothetical protein
LVGVLLDDPLIVSAKKGLFELGVCDIVLKPLYTDVEVGSEMDVGVDGFHGSVMNALLMVPSNHSDKIVCGDCALVKHDTQVPNDVLSVGEPFAVVETRFFLVLLGLLMLLRTVLLTRPFVKVRVVDGLSDNFFSGLPRKWRVAVRAPHLVTPFDFVDPRSAFGTRFGRCEDQLRGLYVFLVTRVNVVSVVFFSFFFRLEAPVTHFHATNTALMVPARDKTSTLVCGTRTHDVGLFYFLETTGLVSKFPGSEFLDVQRFGDDVLEHEGQVHPVAPSGNADSNV